MTYRIFLKLEKIIFSEI